MPVFNIYSKRKTAAEQAGKPQPFDYDDLPSELRAQIIHIWNDAIGPCQWINEGLRQVHLETWSWGIWEGVKNALCREYGLFDLAEGEYDPYEECREFLLDPKTKVERLLDIIEFTFQVIQELVPKLSEQDRQQTAIIQDPDDAINELNVRFREHGIGYRFEGKIIRLDSEYLHSHVVKPAIQLLRTAGFKGAEDEFMEAHEYYRKGDFATAIDKANHAFESTMKTICEKAKWGLPKKLNAKALLDHCFQKGLVPAHLQSHFSGLRSTLESGLPTLRNKTPGAGHGKGSQLIEVPGHYASYALHLAATNIVFLVECFKALKK